MKILLVDHEDSFVHNVEQALTSRGAEVLCVRATAPLRQAVRFDPDAVVLSPGPGHPRDRRMTGLARSLLRRWDEERPFLGVCLGHQLVAEYYGAPVVRAESPVHGETSPVRHDGRGIFSRVPSPTIVARYHSLVVAPNAVPAPLEISATSDDGVVMAVRHRTRPVESVQFHPESYLSVDGPRIFSNFLAAVRR
ncbi:MAG TPA: aminodeoxychorismate/anthranilate synthase component II [Thermoplasmata archaeon]|nr:aminodeoxychorismate/anthranilate synthase component II [Thermoplasmata archaeon]